VYLMRLGNAIYKGSIPYNPRPLHNTNGRAIITGLILLQNREGGGNHRPLPPTLRE
jgi:hypothetical protein